ncbi:MAG: PDZ domain-containing protein [Clostridiales bacterium]|jgi:serine protease Do|nr:PDZ domain-containing protein [Clostridiales bacterium]
MLEDGNNKKKFRFKRTGEKIEKLSDMSSEQFPEEGRSFGYSAYTSPVEREYQPFSPQTPSALNRSHTRDDEPRKKKKLGLARFIAMALTSLALIVVSSFITYLFTHYDFQFSSGDGNIKISLIPRPEDPVPTAPLPIVQTPSPTPTSGVSGVPSGVSWDGTVLSTNTPPEAGEMLSLQDIYKKCAPSIVSVYSELQGGSSLGTGIIISRSGYLITNHHVIKDSIAVTITLESGDQYFAAVVGGDEQSDLAVLKIDATGLTPAEFGDSQLVQIGDSVVAIGNPVNQSLTMTNGIISAINRNISYNGYTMTLLQTNAAINEGNSGGPLINMYGQIIGITNMKMVSYYSTIEGIGFAIPTNTAKPIVDEILENGYVAGRPSLGVLQSDITISASIYYGLPKGVYVSGVYTVSDAYEKGIQRGDIICAVNDLTVKSSEELSEIINSFVAGDTVTLKIYRNGNYFVVDVVLADKAKLS